MVRELAHTGILAAMALSLVTLALTTALHFEGLAFLGRTRGAVGRARPVIAITALVALHFAEIGIYALAYFFAIESLGLGGLRGIDHASSLTYFYFAAETYTAVGYGDLVPRGALRLLASAEPLNGLLLLAWSGAFLFRLVERDVPPAASER